MFINDYSFDFKNGLTSTPTPPKSLLCLEVRKSAMFNINVALSLTLEHSCWKLEFLCRYTIVQ